MMYICQNYVLIKILSYNHDGGEREWTLKNLHFTPYLSKKKNKTKQKTLLHPFLCLPLAHYIYYNLRHKKTWKHQLTN